MPINCCPTCHGNYPARIIDVINGEADYPYCSGRKALPGKISFAALHSDLMEDWDFIANYYLVNPDACSTKPVNQGFKGLGNQK